MSKAFTRFGTYQASSEGKQHFKEITSKYDIQGLGEIMQTLQILYAFLYQYGVGPFFCLQYSSSPFQN
jgi:hypothetical protein